MRVFGIIPRDNVEYLKKYSDMANDWVLELTVHYYKEDNEPINHYTIYKLGYVDSWETIKKAIRGLKEITEDGSLKEYMGISYDWAEIEITGAPMNQITFDCPID